MREDLLGRGSSRSLRIGQICLERKCSNQKAQQEPGNKVRLSLMCPEDRRQHWLMREGERDKTGKAGCGQIQEFRFYSLNNKN